MKDEIEKSIQQAFQEIDDAIDVPAPSVHAISMLVQEKHAVYKKQVMRELRIFFAVAIVITALLLVVLTNSPVVYVVIQIAGLAVMLIYAAVRVRMRNREERHL
ncbi:MAG: YxlC family protein [Bacillus sp. (in: firmicutes)]